MISRGINSSVQRELDSFSKEVMGGDFNIREVTKGAFTQARAKLSPLAFKELNQTVVTGFYEGAPYQVWHQHRLLAVDGSRLMLPRHDSVIAEFGVYGLGSKGDSNQSMAITSLLYDPLNLITLDAQIAPYASSERDLLYQHLAHSKPGDLLLLDRGYPSLGLFFLLKALKVEFCIRMKEDWLVIKEFFNSGEKEGIVEFSLPKKDRHLLKDYPQMHTEKISCRLIIVELENGGKEILCTSLTSSNKYLIEDFKELYHFRWNIEEGYKLFKCRLEVENFSGRTAGAVKQDFYAKIFMMSLCASLAFPIEQRVRKEHEDKKTKHSHKINRTYALSSFRNVAISMFIKKNWQKALFAFDNIVSKTTEIVRPGRSNVRKHKPRKAYFMNYKRL